MATSTRWSNRPDRSPGRTHHDDTPPPGIGVSMVHTPIGRKRWAIAEGYIPGWSHGPEPQMISHETACLLNAGPHDALVEITLYFTDRDPAGPYRITLPARRT